MIKGYIRAGICFVSLLYLSACKTTPPPAAAAPVRMVASPVNIGTLGKDLSAVGKDLTNSPVDTNSLAKDLTTLGGDLPTLGRNLQSLGTNPNRAGNVPTTLETDLAALGGDLAVTVPAGGAVSPSKDVSDLSKLLASKPAPTDAQVQTQLGTLATDLKTSGTHLAKIGTDLGDSTMTNDLAMDIGPLSVAPSVFGQHVKKLGLDLQNPPAASPGDLMPLLGSDLLVLGKDMTPPALTNERTSLPYLFFISTGATFQSSYTVNFNPNATPRTSTLTNSGNSTVGYLEFSYFDRFVLRPDRQTNNLGDYDSGWDWPDNRGFWHSILRPDFEWHIGFVFGSGTNPTNFSSSTIAGSGNFYTDTSIGIPLSRKRSVYQLQQLSLEFSGGLSTDENFIAVHPSAFAGVGYQTSFNNVGALFGGTNYPAFIIGRVGYGFTDVPYLASPGVNLSVSTTDLPQYVLKGAPALGAYIAYPLASGTYLTVRANAYFMRSPSPWNISAGVTIPLDNIGKVFGH